MSLGLGLAFVRITEYQYTLTRWCPVNIVLASTETIVYFALTVEYTLGDMHDESLLIEI